MKQLAMKLGPRRAVIEKGPAASRRGEKPGVSHLRRAQLSGREPVHVTLRVLPGIGYLRSYGRVRAIKKCLSAARELLGMLIVHYSIQGDHQYLIVEPEGTWQLSTGMQGLSVRLARA